MIHKTNRRQGGAWLRCVLVLWLAVPVALALSQEAREQVAQGTAASAARPDTVWRLASEGRFDEGLSQVSRSVLEAGEGSPYRSLKGELATYERHTVEWRQRNHAKYEAKLAEASEKLEAGELIESLNAAIWAGDVVGDPRAMVGLPLIERLTSESEIAATQFESEGNWLRSLPIFSRLSALHEPVDRDRYRAALMRNTTRVVLLRLYAPDHLLEMARKIAEEEGVDPPQPWDDEEGWDKHVAGATREILIESLKQAAETHVENGGYGVLLTGGVERLRTLATTGGLSESFAGLGDAEAVRLFSEGLSGLEARAIKDGGEKIEGKSVVALVHGVMRLNEETIRLPEEVVVREFGDGAMSQLDDFTSLIWPSDVVKFRRMMEQNYSGVGIQITQTEPGGSSAEPIDATPGIPNSRYRLTVVTPLENSPAMKAGIHPGDTIETINGKSARGIDTETAVNRITGPRGTTVTLGIRSPGSVVVRDVELVRSVIAIDTVRGWNREAGAAWNYYIDPERKIGYVRMSSFGPDTVKELDQAVRSMLNGKGIEGLILDLRGNGGGRLDAAHEVADRFLREGVIVSTTRTLDTLEATKPGTYPDFPVVVLINGGSASASEIVSGALKDHGRALIVGQRSYGKGSVQNVVSLAEDTAFLKVTTQYYRLPKGSIVHRRDRVEGWGVEPDVTVPMTSRQQFTAYQARTLLDILLCEGEEVKPEHVLNLREDAEEDEKLPPICKAEDILTNGLDPQLETALLLMKTKLIGVEKG